MTVENSVKFSISITVKILLSFSSVSFILFFYHIKFRSDFFYGSQLFSAQFLDEGIQ